MRYVMSVYLIHEFHLYYLISRRLTILVNDCIANICYECLFCFFRSQEQASNIQSPGLFNLDDMQSNEHGDIAPSTSENDINSAVDSGFSTPTKTEEAVIIGTETTADNIEAPLTTPKVTKLQLSSGDVDDFNFDAWDEDEIDVSDNKDSDETAERMRQESQKLAQQIMKEEKSKEERLRVEEEERNKQELERIHQEEARLRRLEEEAEATRIIEQRRLEQEMQAAEEARVAEKETLEKIREEEERLRLEEEARLLEEHKQIEQVRRSQEEARRLQLEEEEQKRKRLEVEIEAKRLEEEEAKIEKERPLCKEEEKLDDGQLEEQTQGEIERTQLSLQEEERLSRLDEEERLGNKQKSQENDGIAEEEISLHNEQQGWEHEEIVANIEDSMLGENGCSGRKEGGVDDEIIPPGLDGELSKHCNIKMEETYEPVDALDTVKHGDAMNGLNHVHSHEEATRKLPLTTDVQNGNGDEKSDSNSGHDDKETKENPHDRTLFGSTAADLASSMFDNQATNLFTEATKSASMFSWGQSHNSTTRDEAEMNGGLSSEQDVYNDEDLDAMYDDDDDDDDDDKTDKSETQDETDNQNLDNLQKDDDGVDHAEEIADNGRIPPTSAQHTVEDFVKQLERMSESHQLELSEMQRSHQVEIERLHNELSLERNKKEKDKSRKEIASQDKFLSQVRELEKKFNSDLKEKDDELQTIMQRNEGMQLKMDSMKHEVDGLIKLVDERDDEIAALKQGHGKSMVQVEGKVKDSEEELARKDSAISDLKANVSSLQADFDSTSEAYHALKERAKSIATELKDRRMEVRTLTSQNQELSSSKTLLETQLANLRAVVNQHELAIGYKDKDMEVLNAKVKELEKQIEGKEKSIQDSSAVGEKAIASYKRKAQEALAAANSRLALSNQAREEAESEAKAAKSTSDDAVKRARDAESKMAEAEQRASAATALLNELKISSSEEINALKENVDTLQATINGMDVEAEEDSSERERMNVEMGQLRTNLVEEKKKGSELREKLIEQQAICTSLQREVNDLSNEVQRNSAAAFKRANDETTNTGIISDRNSNVFSLDVNGSAQVGDRAEADGTIIMLQQELNGASEAIAELKLALRTALLEKADGDSRERNDESPQGNDSTPLFYAIEKQNELNTARDEINRLANMLGDAEAEKQDAYDIMEDMRLKMEEANARLMRYERLGMKSARPHQNVPQPSYGPFRNTSQSFNIPADNNVLSSGNDSVVNLEYLKNVMLSYLKAKTLADRRKLVPVIATVLCLTPEEQAQAVSSVEESAGLSGVAVSFWENLGES